jgi:hypothetical protein
LYAQNALNKAREMGNSTAIAMKHYFEIVDARAARASNGELNRSPGLGGRRVFDRKYVYG